MWSPSVFKGKGNGRGEKSWKMVGWEKSFFLGEKYHIWLLIQHLWCWVVH
jgi:hypothetical protein